MRGGAKKVESRRRIMSATQAEWPSSAETWWQKAVGVLRERPALVTVAADFHSIPEAFRPDPAQPPTPAAVLVPFACDSEGTIAIVFIVRPATMRFHANHVAFPGGKVDPGDEGPIAAALRETYEEIGIGPTEVEIAGPFGEILTATSNFSVTPVAGRLRRVAPGFSPNAAEVATIVAVPLSHLQSPANRCIAEAEIDGVRFSRLEFYFGPHIIWGATARILDALLPALPAPPH